ncbi:MAG: replication protein RepA [Thermoanaerobaculia bacterium]
MMQILQAEKCPPDRFRGIDSRDVHEAGALGFMPRMFVLTTLPHSRPTSHRFERLNGRYSLRLEARRSVGLPYGIYPRLILTYLTTQAIRTKSREIDLGWTPNDFARMLGLTPISGPRGTAKRLHDQLQRLLSTRFRWQYSKDFRAQESGDGLITSGNPTFELLKACFQRGQPTWSPTLVLSRQFFQEINCSAVPVDLRVIELLKGSPLAIDTYIWLTYRMSYLRRPCLIPWNALEKQFGATYSRSRDFRRSFHTHLREVVGVYPGVRLRQTDSGLLLFPSPPHVQSRPRTNVRSSLRQLATGCFKLSL